MGGCVSRYQRCWAFSDTRWPQWQYKHHCFVKPCPEQTDYSDTEPKGGTGEEDSRWCMRPKWPLRGWLRGPRGPHVLFPLTFDTDLRWVAKIPINGTADKWDELSASALTSEAETMRLLKRETTIPLPNVLDFSSTTHNALRCHYIIMSFISGAPLYDVWFGHRLNGASHEAVRACRTRALDSIASAMVQLERFSFPTGGRLLFGSDGSLSGIGPMRQVDHKAMLDRWLVHKDPDDDLIDAELAPTSDPKAYSTSMLDRHPEQSSVSKGLEMLLRQLIGWIPEPDEMDPFVLAHPDIDIQNFIVSENGDLRGLIDWDGVVAVPRTVGNKRYPG